MLISNYAIKFRIAVVVFVIVFVLAGIVSYMELPREGSPDITIPYVFVTAIYDGTAPEDMEKLVTVQIEKQLNDLENVKEIRSTTSDSMSFISIEFLADRILIWLCRKQRTRSILHGLISRTTLMNLPSRPSM